MFSKWFRFFSTLLDLSFILIFNTLEINAEERFRLASDVAKNSSKRKLSRIEGKPSGNKSI